MYLRSHSLCLSSFSSACLRVLIWGGDIYIYIPSVLPTMFTHSHNHLCLQEAAISSWKILF
jgi:hypothetical protein